MMMASLALFALMVLTFADVVMRSVFNAPIEAATELIRIGIALIVFSALPILSWRSQHIAVDLLDGP
ncbi:TRAP transporter small permease subunit, partial [Sulfitobacter sp. Ks18]